MDNYQSTYQIKVEGVLGESWTDWLDGVTMTTESGITTLTGALDHAALHGILFKIRDLNLKLISVNQINPDISGEINDENSCTCWQSTEGWKHRHIDRPCDGRSYEKE